MLKNKIIANLKKLDHTIVLDNEEHAAIYEVDLDTLNRTIHQLVDESTLVARSNEDFWGFDIGGGDEILCRLGETYFTFFRGRHGCRSDAELYKSRSRQTIN